MLQAAQAPSFAQEAGAVTPEIVVTGSRIVRRDYSAASPIITVNSSSFKNTGQVGLETQLNKLPQFVPGANQFSGAADVQIGPQNSPGAATLNLRGLGSNRNLVLIDGRRAQPFNASLAIDINSIPAAAIDSVEVITGGAAAVYGADAIAGVVNFKLRHDFQGVEFDGQWGESAHGDGKQIQGSMLLGANLADDNGNVMIGLNYAKRDPVYQKDRSFYSAAYTDPLTTGDIFLPIPQYSFATAPGAFSSNFPSENAVNCVFSGDTSALTGLPGCPYPARAASGTVVVDTNPFSPTAGLPGGGTFGINGDGTLFVPGAANLSANAPRAFGYNGPLAPDYKVAPNGPYGLQRNNMAAELSLPIERYAMFANGHYDINDYVTAFVQGSFTQSKTTSVSNFTPAAIAWSANIPYGGPAPSNALYPFLPFDPDQHAATDIVASTIDPASFVGATLPQYVAQGCAPVGGCTYAEAYNAALPAQLKTLLDSRGNPDGSWNLDMELPYLGPDTIVDTTDTYQALAGIKGKIPSFAFFQDWTYEAYGSHGYTTVTTDFVSGFMNTAAYQNLISQPFFGAGYSNDVPFVGRKATCTTGLPVFTQFTPSQDCIDIIAARMKTETTIEQNIAEIDLQGGLFDLPAGQLRAAIGGDYRLDAFAFKPDPIMTSSNILSSAAGIFDVAPAGGQTSVSEVYGELLVPVLKDLPLVKSFGLELGARYSTYNIAGEVPTYKAIASWAVVDWLTFRGGYQLANRAPNVAELFEAPTTVVTPFLDPCSNQSTASYGNIASNPNRSQVQALCTALTDGTPIDSNFVGFGTSFAVALDLQIGSPKLQSESATTWTAGAILKSPWQSPLLDRLTVSIDWYNIKISNAIQGLTSASVYEQCLNGTGGNPTYDPTNTYCKLIHVRGFGLPSGVDGIFTNLGAIRTTGVDVQLDWAADIADTGLNIPGALTLNVVLNSLQRYENQSGPGATFVDYAGTTGNGISGAQFNWKLYTTIGYSVGPANVSLSWRHLPELKNINILADRNAAHDEFDLAGNLDLWKNLSLRAGLENIFDAQPETVGRVRGGSNPNNATGLTDPGFYDTLGRRFYLGFTAKL